MWFFLTFDFKISSDLLFSSYKDSTENSHIPFILLPLMSYYLISILHLLKPEISIGSRLLTRDFIQISPVLLFFNLFPFLDPIHLVISLWQFFRLSLFLMTDTGRVFLRYFVECPSIGVFLRFLMTIILFSYEVIHFWWKIGQGEVTFSLYYQQYTILMRLFTGDVNLTTW